MCLFIFKTDWCYWIAVWLLQTQCAAVVQGRVVSVACVQFSVRAIALVGAEIFLGMERVALEWTARLALAVTLPQAHRHAIYEPKPTALQSESCLQEANSGVLELRAPNILAVVALDLWNLWV